MFDCHVHTDFSSDCRMNIKEVMEIIENNNFGAIITEHMDLNFPEEGEFVFDINKYFNEYSKYRGDKLLLGVELGMRMDCPRENEKIAKEFPFDFIIGSLHLLDKDGNYFDIFGKDLYEGRAQGEVYSSYLNRMYECLKEHSFIDTLGHIDFISRYSPYEDREIYYSDHEDILNSIFKTLIENEIAIEINTRRFSDEKAIDNLTSLYKRFKELGGKYVTLGSDAHVRGNIGSNLLKAYQLAEYCNLKPVYFRNRKKEYMKY